MTEKLAVIGFDALDYHEVRTFGLDTLMQAEHGKIDNTPSLMTGNAVSPTQWTSFMTGLPPSEHRVYGFDWDFPFSDWLYRIPTPGWGMEEILKKVLMKVGREKDFPGPDAIQAHTFIDQLGDRILSVNAPLYQFSFKAKGERLAAMGRHKKDLTHEELKKNLRVHSELVHEDVMEALGTGPDWEVFFTYYYWLDGIQHQFYMDRECIRCEYDRAGFYLRKIKEALPEDCTVIVVSDHGADGEGGHRNSYGFWSCNKEGVVPENPSILDFYDVVMRHTGLPTRRDEHRTKEKLSDLGYI